MFKIVLILVTLNMLTAWLLRTANGGRLEVPKLDSTQRGRTFLIAGLMSQPDTAYSQIGFHTENTVELKYSMFGFNPRNVARQLRELVKPDDTLVGISIGCKPIVLSSEIRCKERFLINPLTHYIAVSVKTQVYSEYFGPVLEILVFLLGWIALLPVITTKQGNKYSLALAVDQILYIYYADPKADSLRYLNRRTGAILSAQDQVVDFHIASGIYKNTQVFEVDTPHARTDNVYAAKNYQEAIDAFEIELPFKGVIGL